MKAEESIRSDFTMPNKLNVQYPFEPKSAASLVPGQFWTIPLSNGEFACGRVLQLKPKGQTGSRVTFLAGLMDWCGRIPPNEAAIAGAKCIKQGGAHFKTILENGRIILGYRPLDLDGIEPWTFRGANCWVNSCVQHGFTPIRKQLATDDDLPVFSTWGYKVISILAEKHFVRQS